MSTPIPFPRMLAVRQKFPQSQPLDIPAVVQHEFKAQNVLSRLQPGAQIAVGVGSRGISNIKNIVAAVLDQLKAAGAKPFIIPAMGSHGGATPEGQIGVLESYRITGQSMGVPIRASMEVEHIGSSGLLLQGFAELARACLHLVEQAYVLDGDHCLVGKGLGQLDLLCGEGSHLSATERQATDCLTFSQ